MSHTYRLHVWSFGGHDNFEINYLFEHAFLETGNSWVCICNFFGFRGDQIELDT
jgi:hypothetical protein